MENSIQGYIREIMTLLHCESTLQLFMIGFMTVIIVYMILLMLIAHRNPRRFNYNKRKYSEIGYMIALIAMLFGSLIYELVQSPLLNYIFIWSIVIVLDTRIIQQLGN